MQVYVASVFDCPPEKVWEEVGKSSLLLEVIRPLVRLAPVDPPVFPERWVEGAVVRCKVFLLRVLPLGVRTLVFERIDPAAREIQTRESEPLFRRWDHLIRIRSTPDGRTHYSDELEIDAGLLTAVACIFVHGFYRYRQWRWRRVVRRLNEIKETTPNLRNRDGDTNATAAPPAR
jgi:hypothetical protein